MIINNGERFSEGNGKKNIHHPTTNQTIFTPYVPMLTVVNLKVYILQTYVSDETAR